MPSRPQLLAPPSSSAGTPCLRIGSLGFDQPLCYSLVCTLGESEKCEISKGIDGWLSECSPGGGGVAWQRIANVIRAFTALRVVFIPTTR
ncbi:hypothetical protein FH972_002506 [Carpinus fangiana]|uniref:Uncharacterized protein n=1 Tax=Carpinus fangiana TaxID=176857 RepID=A0A5N6QF31_9ROSI|nr:hypothetical protein FH972_002506 [Carpinus fangiana]